MDSCGRACAHVRTTQAVAAPAPVPPRSGLRRPCDPPGLPLAWRWPACALLPLCSAAQWRPAAGAAWRRASRAPPRAAPRSTGGGAGCAATSAVIEGREGPIACRPMRKTRKGVANILAAMPCNAAHTCNAWVPASLPARRTSTTAAWPRSPAVHSAAGSWPYACSSLCTVAGGPVNCDASSAAAACSVSTHPLAAAATSR